jgi:uncharacterized membrane protein
MIHADYRYHLNVEPELAFDYLANPVNDQHWQSSCAAVEMAAAQPDVGAGYKITFNFLGRKMDFSCQITEREPLKRYAFKVLEGPFYYQGCYDFSPTAEGLDVHWQFEAEPGRFFGILPASLLRKVLVSQVERDLVKLRRLLPVAQPA